VVRDPGRNALPMKLDECDPGRRGALYVVATPIGNLEDLSRRAVRLLSEVDLIAAEDTRRTVILLDHHGIDHSRMVSYYEHNEEIRTEPIIARLKTGESVALVSSAGTPGISDPGFRLVQAAHREGLAVISVPGPSAPVAALAVSGLPTAEWIFLGFPPKGDRLRAWFESAGVLPYTLVFFESPNRLPGTLRVACQALGEGREAAVCRELTKIHEEVRRGTLDSLAHHYASHQPRGEITVVIAGRDDTVPSETAGDEVPVMTAQVRLLVQAGYRTVDAVRIVARGHNVGRSELYRAFVIESGS